MFMPDIRLRRIRVRTERFLPLLLMADDRQAEVEALLRAGTLYGLFVRRRQPVSLTVITDETAAFAPGGPRVHLDGGLRGKRVAECRLLVTAPAFRGKGLARQLLMRVCGLLDTTFEFMIVGTGTVPRMDRFYRGCGFTPCFVLPHFFLEAWHAPIWEDGILLDDMQYYARRIARAASSTI